jgi:hypothetical protein
VTSAVTFLYKMYRGPHKMYRGSHNMYRGLHNMYRGPHKMYRGPHKMHRGPHKTGMQIESSNTTQSVQILVYPPQMFARLPRCVC